jgi:hypothetical protein
MSVVSCESHHFLGARVGKVSFEKSKINKNEKKTKLKRLR